MWIKEKEVDIVVNLNLCESVFVLPYGYNQHGVYVRKNGDNYCIGAYNTEDEANKAFETIWRAIARNDYLITME